MQISIIIPCLNESADIRYFLLRLQKLRTKCVLILVDGGSDDETVDIAQPYVDHLIVSEPGRARQMNAGANVVQSGILLFLHADTFLPEDAINQIDLAIEAGHQWGRFDVFLVGSHFLLPMIATLMNWRSALTQIVTGDQGLFVEKTLFDKVGQYPDIALMEDIALSKALKLLTAPYRIRSCVQTSARRWIEFGVIKTVLLMWWCRGQFFFGIDPTYLQQLYRRGQFWIR
ncbi:MAG: rSAM/selenodomain-associated transferase 2 [Methylophagaceae bacterium]|jgi:rSAM/selenodomain-associated transferase 2